MKLSAPRPLRALDRFLLMTMPTLRSTRLHYVIPAGILSITIAYGLGSAIPLIPTTSGGHLDESLPTVYFFLAMTASFLVTLYWMAITLRDFRHQPFSTRVHLGLLYLAYVVCIGVINLAPFILLMVFNDRARASALSGGVSDILEAMAFATIIVGLLLAGITNAGRTMRIRPLVVTTVVAIALFVLMITLSEFVRGAGASVWTIWLAFYFLCLVFAYAIRFRKRSSVVSRSALVCVFASSPIVALVFAALTMTERGTLERVETSNYPTLLLTGFVMAWFVAFILEKSIAWQRALPS